MKRTVYQENMVALNMYGLITEIQNRENNN